MAVIVAFGGVGVGRVGKGCWLGILGRRWGDWGIEGGRLGGAALGIGR